jgi:hypothetical protein
LREILVSLGHFAKRPVSLGLVAAFVISWLAYSWLRYAIAGDSVEASESRIEDVLVLYLVAALVQVSIARYFGREAMAIDRPRLVAWFVLTIFLVAGTYALAFVLQVLGYLLAKDLIGGWPWHQAAEGAIAAAILFPLVVWQMSLLTGTRGVGLRQSLSGVWKDRPLVVVVALAFYFLTFAGQVLLKPAIPEDAGEAALAMWSIVVLLPTAVGYVLTVLLAFVTFAAIWQKVSEAQGVFD